MKTAMQKLIEQVEENILKNIHYHESPRLREGAAIVKIIAESLLDVEKQQIKDAWLNGGSTLSAKNAEEFYNETYTSNAPIE